jgi:hypothetical protein
MKNRLQDVIDLQYLFEAATDDDMDKAEQLLTLITERGYNRNKDLERELRTHLSRNDPSDK